MARQNGVSRGIGGLFGRRVSVADQPTARRARSPRAFAILDPLRAATLFDPLHPVTVGLLLPRIREPRPKPEPRAEILFRPRTASKNVLPFPDLLRSMRSARVGSDVCWISPESG
jgi:hypothetical protein